jgi:hypothetical protein
MDNKIPPTPPPPGSIACSACGEPMPEERKELLGVTTCIKCTKPKKKPIGTWDYPEGFHERMEGVGGLIILDEE